MVDVRDITGLILAGGLGSRMGGADKGLQHFRGLPLALHARQRLAPQVADVMVSANRNLDAYAGMGMPVWPDQREDFPGPLAGMLAGLAHCSTPYLVTVPCDSPCFPLDLVQRLAQALAAADADIAVAATTVNGASRRQPVFCLMKATLMPNLRDAVNSGERKVDAWTARHRRVEVVFDDPAAFANANTLQDLARLQTPG